MLKIVLNNRFTHLAKAVIGETAFQTFNNYLSNIVRKGNATITGPSKQITGEFAEGVPFKRLYEMYHGWDQVKRSIDTMHQKFIGAGIKVTSNSEEFDYFWKRWEDTVNFQQKMSEFYLSVFITGNGIVERQYMDDGRMGNLEHIPMWTIYRIFRDEFGYDIKLVQDIDGVFKELDPQYYGRWWINNPDRQAFGKSEFYSLAAPRKVAGTVDPDTGESINPEKTMISLLDAQAVLQNAEVEIKRLMAKPRIFASFPGMPQEQLTRIESELQDPDNNRTIWAFDRDAKMAEAQINSQGKFAEYGANVDNHIDIAFGFASKIISNPGAFSYSSSQTPLDVLDQRMNDLQTGAKEMIKDEIIRPLVESWQIDNYDDLEIEVAFQPSVRRLTMEDVQKLPPDAVSPAEKRAIMKDLNVPLDDKLYDAYQKASQPQPFGTDVQSFDKSMGGPPGRGGGGGGGGGPGGPGGRGGSGGPPKQNPQTPSRPTPPRKDSGGRRRAGESVDDYIDRSVIEGVNRAIERITMSPQVNTSDLYVPGGLSDEEISPEVTNRDIHERILQAFGEPVDDNSQSPMGYNEEDEIPDPVDRYELPGKYYPERSQIRVDDADPFQQLGGDDGTGWGGGDITIKDIMMTDDNITPEDIITAYRGKNAPNPNDNYDITGPIVNKGPQKTSAVPKTVPRGVNDSIRRYLNSSDPRRRKAFRDM